MKDHDHQQLRDAYSGSRHFTQWAAQFAVASELCKRGYEVAFTMGNNAPLADLMVVSPGKRTFLIDVKGQRTGNFWRIRQRKTVRNDLYYVLAYVPADKPNRFFILPDVTIHQHMKEYEVSGVKFDARFSGFNWGTCLPYENQWNALPA